MGKGGFRGGFGGGNMNNMIKQAQKMQQEMLKKQEELDAAEVEAQGGGGAVVVRANGKQEILSIKIDSAVVDPEDVETLEDLVMVTVNQALREAQKLAADEMSKLTGGLNIPGLF